MHQRHDAFTDKNRNHRKSLDPLGDLSAGTIFHFGLSTRHLDKADRMAKRADAVEM